MMKVPLDEQRCANCKKLLFRGLIGLGLVEVKCSRCGELNLLHSFEELFRSQPDAYIIVFGADGKIVAASRTAERILGYSEQDFDTMNMTELRKEFRKPTESMYEVKDSQATMADGSLLARKANHIQHRTKSGQSLTVTVRYYPFGSYSGEYTLGIFSPKSS